MTSTLPLSLRTTGITLGFGALGAGVAWLVSAPVYMLIGPAVAVFAASLAGVKTDIAPGFRDLNFIVLGLAVGAGFNDDALAAMIRWPFAIAAMAVAMWASLLASRAVLVRAFHFAPRTALLAAAPGHLSFVLSMGAEMGKDLPRIAITQSVRLLSLTVAVPFIALGLGVNVGGSVVPQGVLMTPVHLVILAVAGLGLGLLFRRLSVPAPLLMGPMVLSAVAHLTGLAPGVLPDWLVLPAYLVLGSLIGARFSGTSLAELRLGLASGLTVTGIAVLICALAAAPVAWALEMPLAHVLMAFAPGGLETMIAMGVVLGVVPGFVAACHIARLGVLTLLLPVMLAQSAKAESKVRAGPL